MPAGECMEMENSFAYEYEVVRCHAMYAQSVALKKHFESNPDDQGATFVRLVKHPARR